MEDLIKKTFPYKLNYKRNLRNSRFAYCAGLAFVAFFFPPFQKNLNAQNIQQPYDQKILSDNSSDLYLQNKSANYATNRDLLKTAQETADLPVFSEAQQSSEIYGDQKFNLDGYSSNISRVGKPRSYINPNSLSTINKSNSAKASDALVNSKEFRDNLYNKELYFNQFKDSGQLSDFRDIDGRLTPRYSEEKLSIYDPKTPTPSRFYAADLSMPETFSSTNNLAKKTGSFYRAYGEIIFIQGTIADSFGVPIHNAVIEVWQTNSAGKYHSLVEPSSEYIDKFFNMSGRAITDNLGNYYFITIMPGATSGRAPHINFNIYHPRFGKLETEMYFEKHPYNKTDSQYLSYTEEERNLITANASNTNILDPKSIKIFTFNIVMRGIHQYKKF